MFLANFTKVHLLIGTLRGSIVAAVFGMAKHSVCLHAAQCLTFLGVQPNLNCNHSVIPALRWVLERGLSWLLSFMTSWHHDAREQDTVISLNIQCEVEHSLFVLSKPCLTDSLHTTGGRVHVSSRRIYDPKAQVFGLVCHKVQTPTCHWWPIFNFYHVAVKVLIFVFDVWQDRALSTDQNRYLPEQ